VKDENLRIAVDIGGTFTDCVLLAASGARTTTKALTTSDDPSRGVIACLDAAAVKLNCSVQDILKRTTAFVHGTTVGTNAFASRRGSRTGLLMTRGHEHAFIIGRVRQKVTGLSEREKTHVTHLVKADPPIVAPEDIRPVTERIDSRGNVVVPLDLEAAERELDDLVASGVKAIAICLLWSFANPDHEVRLKELVRRKYPDIFLSISSEIAPRMGEYERCVSTVFNSYIGPIVGDYLTRLEQRLSQLGMRCQLLVMQSSGGLSTVASILGRPLLIVDSGPAGGVLGSRMFSNLIRHENILCADVGGTTFDVGLVSANRIQMESAPVLDRYSFIMPKIYVKSIGAGGGSIAWIDDGGTLRVGPHSAGSVPGPVAYGRGGSEPTVTDAHLALGYLDADHPLGGSVRLDKQAAIAALGRLGEKLGMTAIQAAAGIVEISNAHISDLARKLTVERGLDPRRFLLFAYGGAGPVFGAFVARELGSKLTYVAADAGVFSALGMLTTDIEFREERSVNLRFPMAEEAIATINRVFAELEQRVIQRFKDVGFDPGQVGMRRAADTRFRMQFHELEMDVPAGTLSAGDLDRVSQDFFNTYERIYGKDSGYKAGGMEYVTVRAVGTIEIERPALEVVPEPVDGLSRIGQRQAFFAPAGFIETAIHAGNRLAPGQELSGPAIIQRSGDTVVLPPGTDARVDPYGGILISWQAEAMQ
jgi:N-methylhydantoinase A